MDKRKPKKQSRMENQEKTEEAIKNGQSRENRRGNQEWTIKRKQKRQSRMDKRKPKKQSSMDNQENCNIVYTRERKKQKTQHPMCWTPQCGSKHKYRK